MQNSISRWIINLFNPPGKSSMDLGRRRVLTAGVLGLGSGLLFRVQPLAGGNMFNSELIRPPGSIREEEFLGKCIRCGQCMKVCPTNVVQPTLLEAGLEGMWSPLLKMSIGYCEYKCSICTQVCPTGAIKPLNLEEKQKTKIGLASIDKNRCLPYAYSKPCTVCEEQCPLPEKAIRVEEKTLLNRRGNKAVVRQPHINADLCIGCGICENKCPVTGKAAIRVFSVNEVRNPKNRLPVSQ